MREKPLKTKAVPLVITLKEEVRELLQGVDEGLYRGHEVTVCLISKMACAVRCLTFVPELLQKS